jgi:hypothetical protein
MLPVRRLSSRFHRHQKLALIYPQLRMFTARQSKPDVGIPL